MKLAVVFGVTGQDGSYLSELLLEKEYQVLAVTRRVSVNNQERIEHLLDNKNFHIIEADVTDSGSVIELIHKYEVNEIYNLSAQSNVGISFKQPQLTIDVNLKGVCNILEAIRLCPNSSSIKFYQASTSEMFGDNFTEEVLPSKSMGK